MHFLSWIALIFLTLFGYSAGGVLGRKTKPAWKKTGSHPTLIDTAMVVVLWICAVAFRLTTQTSHWMSVAIWFAIALGVSFVLNCIQRPSHGGNTIMQ